jgi:hypothetical protein
MPAASTDDKISFQLAPPARRGGPKGGLEANARHLHTLLEKRLTKANFANRMA